MKDVRIILDGKSQTNESECVGFSLFVPSENNEQQVRYFPFTGEWSIDLTTIREDTPLPTSVSYYGGHDFKLRKYVYCEKNGGKFELVFTDSKSKFEKFKQDKIHQENNFLDELREKAKKRLDRIKNKD